MLPQKSQRTRVVPRAGSIATTVWSRPILQTRQWSSIPCPTRSGLLGSTVDRASVDLVRDFQDLELFIAGWEHGAHAIPGGSRQQRVCHRRDPADMAARDVGFVHSDDAISRGFAVRQAPNGDRRTELDDVEVFRWRADDDRGAQDALELMDAIVGAVPRDQCFELRLHTLRTVCRKVVLGTGREDRTTGPGRSFLRQCIFLRESLA